ncbi:hypothetical protein HMPREF9389_2027 [Streptococcus sanguinis SK355]|uniref:Uncharacterized protein n=1 Tax=Streptococcus sanguinis SK355 TaxID=888816 RepID=F3UT69_STRSA|nr:hypothetical protein HMPREF9389_2027 [Streptococcus sanguinis SK355]
MQKHLEDDLGDGKGRSIDISLIEVLPFWLGWGRKNHLKQRFFQEGFSLFTESIV